MNIQKLLSVKISQAMNLAGIPIEFKPHIHPSNKKKFGDYQVNGILVAAKILKKTPYQLAEHVLKFLDFTDIAKKIEIVAPGFINIFLNPRWISNIVQSTLDLPRLGISPVKTQTIIVDYSAPNVAKEMHVGHIRSTIIGDAIVRTLIFMGHKVIRANHIGDWGTQFGMLIAFIEKENNIEWNNIELSDLEELYCKAKNLYNINLLFAEHARLCVVKLQKGDEFYLKIWKKLVNLTLNKIQVIYDRLNITLTNKDVMGESLYNNMLPDIIEDLKSKNIAVEHNGAIVVFLDEFKNKYGQEMGVIIQKKDGGYLYSTTDIACVKYRYEQLHADRIIYYVDSRQHQHLQQIFIIARKADYIPNNVMLEHHKFGMILDKNGHPFKTRDGGTIKLSNLLDESYQRARILIYKKNPMISKKKVHQLAEVIGIASIKYFDLSKNRTTDYVFDWDHMLNFEGNTAPYLLYAYTRILSLFRKAKINMDNINIDILLTNTYELSLAIRLLQFEEVIIKVARDGTPHIMCSYLYDIASLFSIFYENCPILNINDKITSISRLKLALLTKKTLKQGFDILGIKTIKYM